MIESIIDQCERTLILRRFGEMSAMLHRCLEESPGTEVYLAVVKCREVSSTAWSIALSRATVKDRVFSYSRSKQVVQVQD